MEYMSNSIMSYNDNCPGHHQCPYVQDIHHKFRCDMTHVALMTLLLAMCLSQSKASMNRTIGLESRTVMQERVPVTPTDTIDCASIAPVLLAGNPVANELVRSYCTGRCAEVTGQSIVPRPATFDFIVASIDTVGAPGTLTTLTPIEMLVCGRTLDEVNELLWPLLIRAGVCDTKASCGLDDDVELVDAASGEIACNQYPDRETANPFALDSVTVVAGALLITLMLLLAGISWYRVTVTKQRLVFEQQKYIAELDARLKQPAMRR